MADPDRQSRSRNGVTFPHWWAGDRLLLSIMIGLISACAGPSTPTLPATPDRVGVSAALEPFALARLTAYKGSVGVPSFDLEVWSAEAATRAVEDGRLQLLVAAAPPPSGWFATPLGYEQITIIANPAMRVRDLTLSELSEVFSGIVRTWDEIGGPQEPIQLVIPPEGDDLRHQFDDLLMGNGRFPRTALLAPTPAAMAALVGQTPGAIGLLPYSASTEGTRVIAIDGETPGSEDSPAGGYPLRFEVIATAPEEPHGGVRDWLAWLQEQP